MAKKQKLYRFEVDQSGRVEELNKNTVLALANSEAAFTVLIPARVKRKIYEQHRKQGKPKQFGPQVFATSLKEIIRKSGFQIHEVIIDIEYPGHEKNIEQILKKSFPNIEHSWLSIGKNSPAHKAAYFAYKGKNSVSTVLTTKRLRSLLRGI